MAQLSSIMHSNNSVYKHLPSILMEIALEPSNKAHIRYHNQAIPGKHTVPSETNMYEG